MLDFDSLKRQQKMLMDILSEVLARSSQVISQSQVLNQSHTELSAKVNHLETSYLTLQGEFALLEEKNRVSFKELEAAEARVLELNSDRQSTSQEITGLRQELYALQSENSQNQSQMQQLRKQHVDDQQNWLRLEASLRSQIQQIESLNEKGAEQTALDVRKLKEKYAKQKAKVQNLKLEMQSFISQKDFEEMEVAKVLDQNQKSISDLREQIVQKE